MSQITIETARLLLLQEYLPDFHFIVPELTGTVMILSGGQAQALVNAGVSVSYLYDLPGNKEMFSRSSKGFRLMVMQFEKRLYDLLNKNSISIMPEEATESNTIKEQNHD